MKYNQELFPFKSKWVTIENHNIHYIDEGKGQIILFSHAPIGSSFMYRRFIQILSKKYRCIALDYPGFGLSTNHENQKYSIVTQKKILYRFISKLKLTDIVGLGHDTGGPSLFKVAIEQVHLFKGLILTDTIIFPTKEYSKIHKMLRIIGSHFIQFINAQTNFIVRLTFNKGVVTRKLSKPELNQYKMLFSKKKNRRRITEMLYSLRQNHEFMNEVKKGFEKKLNHKPMLLIYGENDPVTKLGIPSRIHNMLVQTELFLITREGHFPHEGQAEQMCEIIHQWLVKLQSN